MGCTTSKPSVEKKSSEQLPATASSTSSAKPASQNIPVEILPITYNVDENLTFEETKQPTPIKNEILSEPTKEDIQSPIKNAIPFIAGSAVNDEKDSSISDNTNICQATVRTVSFADDERLVAVATRKSESCDPIVCASESLCMSISVSTDEEDSVKRQKPAQSSNITNDMYVSMSQSASSDAENVQDNVKSEVATVTASQDDSSNPIKEYSSYEIMEVSSCMQAASRSFNLNTKIDGEFEAGSMDIDLCCSSDKIMAVESADNYINKTTVESLFVAEEIICPQVEPIYELSVFADECTTEEDENEQLAPAVEVPEIEEESVVTFKAADEEPQAEVEFEVVQAPVATEDESVVKDECIQDAVTTANEVAVESIEATTTFEEVEQLLTPQDRQVEEVEAEEEVSQEVDLKTSQYDDEIVLEIKESINEMVHTILTEIVSSESEVLNAFDEVPQNEVDEMVTTSVGTEIATEAVAYFGETRDDDGHVIAVSPEDLESDAIDNTEVKVVECTEEITVEEAADKQLDDELIKMTDVVETEKEFKEISSEFVATDEVASCEVAEESFAIGDSSNSQHDNVESFEVIENINNDLELSHQANNDVSLALATHSYDASVSSAPLSPIEEVEEDTEEEAEVSTNDAPVVIETVNGTEDQVPIETYEIPENVEEEFQAIDSIEADVTDAKDFEVDESEEEVFEEVVAKEEFVDEELESINEQQHSADLVVGLVEDETTHPILDMVQPLETHQDAAEEVQVAVPLDDNEEAEDDEEQGHQEEKTTNFDEGVSEEQEIADVDEEEDDEGQVEMHEEEECDDVAGDISVAMDEEQSEEQFEDDDMSELENNENEIGRLNCGNSLSYEELASATSAESNSTSGTSYQSSVTPHVHFLSTDKSVGFGRKATQHGKMSSIPRAFGSPSNTTIKASNNGVDNTKKASSITPTKIPAKRQWGLLEGKAPPAPANGKSVPTRFNTNNNAPTSKVVSTKVATSATSKAIAVPAVSHMKSLKSITAKVPSHSVPQGQKKTVPKTVTNKE